MGVVVFPGTNCDRDTLAAVESCGGRAEPIWHAEEGPLTGYDAIVLPGGFAHGDALRAGAIARFSPVMRRVIEFAGTGRLVLGICNGFQVLLECGLLPGAMLRNDSLQFRAGWVHCRVEADTPFTHGLPPGTVLRLPIAHGEGNYVAPAGGADCVVALRYCDASGQVTPEANPNGSADNIAGIGRGNVFGLMPHPERACSPLLGSTDGRPIFESMLRALLVPA
ncbi:MAG: phosphoribosylformylglycinamidine synthase I [Chloroflexota bacterium]|nr:phosphoribosylformylglycinamidine synthase I [Chloroflexota bacterium]